jgi:hypothetical protein
MNTFNSELSERPITVYADAFPRGVTVERHQVGCTEEQQQSPWHQAEQLPSSHCTAKLGCNQHKLNNSAFPACR